MGGAKDKTSQKLCIGIFPGDSTLRDYLMALLNDPGRWDHLRGLLPEIAALADVPQRPDFHAEGSVLVHTSLALAELPREADARVVWATLLHDIGKASTTALIDGAWRSHGHAEKGAEMVPPILARLGFSEIAEEVAWLVRHHQFFLSWQNFLAGEPLTRHQLKFCRHPLFPHLMIVCRADAKASLGSGKTKILDTLESKIDQEMSC